MFWRSFSHAGQQCLLMKARGVYAGRRACSGDVQMLNVSMLHA